MSNKFVFESLEEFLAHYQSLVEAETEPNKPASSGTSPWEFKFESGKFKKDDVTPDQLKKLEDDFNKKIVPLLSNQNYIGQKLDVSISAASSKVPVSPSGNVAKELQAAGYTPDNVGLCKARGATVVNIIKDLLYKTFGEGIDRKVFMKELDKKMTLSNKPLPNIGPEYSKSAGDNPDDQKYKDNQFISAALTVSGEKIPDDRFILCKMDKKFSGGQASAANGFAGYDETVFIRAKAGQKMQIFFDPITVPDAILFSYSGKEVKLSPFSGTYGAKWVKSEWTQEKEDLWNKNAASGKVATAKKETIKGKNYLVIDYKDYINNYINKGGVLVKAIEAKLKSLGLKPIKELCPEFFDSQGKIEIYRNKNLDQIPPSTNKENPDYTYNLLKDGSLPQSPLADTKSFSIMITKNAVRDSVTLVAFSPISGTAFNIITQCS